MSELIKMQKDYGTMLVPPAKLQEFLKAGWVEIERVLSSDSPAPAEPKASEKAAQAEEIPAEAVESDTEATPSEESAEDQGKKKSRK